MRAIEATCKEVGYIIRLYVYSDGSYGWDGAQPPSADEWESFHKACVLAEPLRPKEIKPSPALQQILEGAPIRSHRRDRQQQ